MPTSSPERSAILVGQFDDIATARAVSRELQSVGYRPQDIEHFAIGVARERVAEGAAPAERPAGVRVAVRVPMTQLQGRVLGVFSRHAARSIEEARGTWTDGRWRDFDPESEPHWVMPPQR